MSDNGFVASSDAELVNTKALTADALRVADRSVVKPDPNAVIGGAGGGFRFFLLAGGFAKAVPPWGTAIQARDSALRKFAKKEPFLASALYSVCARNATFAWKLEGPDGLAEAAHAMMLQANAGRGWLNFATALSYDLYTQDKGAFVELIRQSAGPDSPVIGFRTLDPAQCWHTGNLEFPVIYFDRYGGAHRMPWWSVYTIAEMPVDDEFLPGMQVSAVSRVLQAAETFLNEEIYFEEKTGGRRTSAIHVLQGIQQSDIDAALSNMQAEADNSLQTRFMMPTVIAVTDPESKPELVTLDLKGVPDGFDFEKEVRRYLTVLSLALGTDYGDLAPLPGNNLGTGAQSEVMADRSKRKGAGIWRKLIEHMVNFAGILPQNVEFVFDDQDLDEEKAKATNAKLRAEARKLRVESGELPAGVARLIALEMGELTEEQYQEAERLAAEEAAVEQQRAAEQAALDRDRMMILARRPLPGGEPPGDVPNDAQPVRDVARAKELSLALAGKETRLAEFLQTRIHRAFTTAADDLAALGYMDTPQRIKLSNIIGDALGLFAELSEDEAIVDVARRRLDDDDVRQILEREKATAESTRGLGWLIAGKGTDLGALLEHRIQTTFALASCDLASLGALDPLVAPELPRLIKEALDQFQALTGEREAAQAARSRLIGPQVLALLSKAVPAVVVAERDALEDEAAGSFDRALARIRRVLIEAEG